MMLKDTFTYGLVGFTSYLFVDGLWAQVAPDVMPGWEKLSVAGILAAVVIYLIREKHGTMKELAEEIKRLNGEIRNLTLIITRQVRNEEIKSGIHSRPSIEPVNSSKGA